MKEGTKITTFIIKQVNDIKNYGISDLFKKIIILIKIFLKLPIYFIALFPCVIMRLIGSFFLIRIDRIPCANFGNLASFIGIYYCKKKLNIDQPSKPYIDILYLDSKMKPSNKYLLKMWKRKLKIFPDTILGPIDKLSKMLPWGKKYSIEILSSRYENDVDNMFEKFQPLSFKQEEEDKAAAILKKFGLKKNDKFVCLAVRDGSYSKVKDHLSRTSFAYHEYRNFDIDDFKLASEELTKKGYYVFRMGVTANKPLVSDNPKVIDYVNSDMRSEFMDIYLGAKCSFCISTGYGFDMIPYIFNKPIGIMSLPVGDLRTHSERFLLLTKHHILIKEKRKLSLSEIFSHGVAYAYETDIFKKNGIELIDYTPEEIKNFVIEMDESLKSKKELNHEDEKLQKRFKNLFALNIKKTDYESQVKSQHKIHGQIRSRFSITFLKENENWLN